MTYKFNTVHQSTRGQRGLRCYTILHSFNSIYHFRVVDFMYVLYLKQFLVGDHELEGCIVLNHLIWHLDHRNLGYSWRRCVRKMNYGCSTQ